MDKISAIKLSQEYLKKIRNNNINYVEAWLFGSYANGNYNENSDIDIALALPNKDATFETEVKLMVLRDGEETIIEPHIYNLDDFYSSVNVKNNIFIKGFRLD